MHNLIKILLVTIIISWNINTKACTIFCASDNNKILMAGNEDWPDPFTKIWVHQKSENNYGVLYISHSDYEIQFGVNEFGLAFDFAAIAKALGNNLKGKLDLDNDLLLELLSKCKTINDALEYLQKYKYQSPFHQILLFDASGQSIIVNQDGIRPKKKSHQTVTNFNACSKETSSKCERFEIINQSLSKKPTITIDLFKNLLSRAHQEGNYPTQYSYILDPIEGNLHLYAFHNFENEVVLNYREIIKKGFMMKNLKSLFPLSYAEQDYRLYHQDSLKQALINGFYNQKVENILETYEQFLKPDADKIKNAFLLLEVANTLIQEIYLTENKGNPFYYWWYPKNYMEFQSQDIHLYKVLKILDYFEQIPKEDPKQNIGVFELKGIAYAFLGNKKMAKTYFTKTTDVCPKDGGNYKRSAQFLQHLNTTD